MEEKYIFKNILRFFSSLGLWLSMIQAVLGLVPSGGMGLQLDWWLLQSLIGHSHKFCVTIASACLAGRIGCRLKVGCWVVVLDPTLEAFL